MEIIAHNRTFSIEKPPNGQAILTFAGHLIIFTYKAEKETSRCGSL
jgi:hypothetical protein